MSRLVLPFLTKLAKASSKSNSLRTTVPQKIIEEFGLDLDDVLIWEIKNGQIVIKKWSGERE